MTDKKRLTTYTEEENIRKFKIISAIDNKSMSEKLEEIVEKYIDDYEREHGSILQGGGVLHDVLPTLWHVVLKTT